MVQGHIRIRVAAIILQQGKILMAKHRRDEREYWVLPGGGVEYGEETEECLRREIMEETGYQVKVGKLILVSESIPPDKHRHILNLFFTAEIVGGKLNKGSDHGRIVDVAFLPIERLHHELVFPAITQEIIEYASNPHGFKLRHLGNRWNE